MKMKARNMRRKGDVEMGMGMGNLEVSKGSGSERIAKERTSSTSTHRILKRRSGSDLKGPAQSSGHNGKLLRPLPIRMPSSQSLLFRRNGREKPHITIASPLVRSNSAPNSPTLGAVEAPSPGLTTLVATDEPSHSRESTHEEPTLPRSARSPKRQVSTPIGFRGNLTDSEALPTSPRLRSQRQRTDPGSPGYFGHAPEPPNTPGINGETPAARRRGKRRQTTRLRLNIPPPISQHFSHGWPHAGSWQDALYGVYDGDQVNGTPSRKSSAEAVPKKPARNRFATPEASDHGSAPISPSTSPARPPRVRTRSRRNKRYRQALVPPTPAGLGFSLSDREKESRVNGHKFDWNVNQPVRPISNEIDEEDGLSRSETRTTTMNEKGQVSPPRKSWWAAFRERRQKPVRRIEEVGWRNKWRRIVFLDARVTIWIRAMNLAVAVVLLGMCAL